MTSLNNVFMERNQQNHESEFIFYQITNRYEVMNYQKQELIVFKICACMHLV